MIKANSNKYSISAMCKFLNISRSLVYYEPVKKRQDKKLEEWIIKIFKESRNNYGSRKIKKILGNLGYQVFIRKIRVIMTLNGLVSNYTVKQFKVHKTKCNNDDTPNIVDRQFNHSGLVSYIKKTDG